MEFNATFLIAAISFIVFVIIMNLIFYKPIEKIVKERENLIDGNFDEAKKNNLTSQKLINDYNKKIEDANYEGKTIINERCETAKAKKNKLISDAQKKVSEDILLNKQELDKTYANAKESLQTEAQNLSLLISKKIFNNFGEGGEG